MEHSACNVEVRVRVSSETATVLENLEQVLRTQLFCNTTAPALPSVRVSKCTSRLDYFGGDLYLNTQLATLSAFKEERRCQRSVILYVVFNIFKNR